MIGNKIRKNSTKTVSGGEYAADAVAAVPIEKMPGQEESKASVDTYVEMRSEWHYIPATMKTSLPDIYPWDSKLPK